MNHKIIKFLLMFLWILNPIYSNEDFKFVGNIIAIRNEEVYTVQILSSFLLSSNNPFPYRNLYSINSHNEITHCFKYLYFYIYQSQYLLHLLKVPCPFLTNNSELIKVGDKIFFKVEPNTSINNKVKEEIQNQKEIPKIIIHPIDKKEMIYVPEDYLLYGQGLDPQDSSFNFYYFEWNLENIPHIQAFYIDKYEVTNKEFLTFCIQTNYSCPAFLKQLKREDWNKPYIFATYKDVEEYALWAKKQIPTEWEWELAAKGGFNEFLKKNQLFDKNLFPEYPSDPDNCNTIEKWEEKPQVIDVYKLKDINFRGIVGLCGNALEWTSSYFYPYPGNRFIKKEHQYLAGRFFRVLKGGAFFLPKEMAKVYKRLIGGSPDFKNDPVGGFRLILRAK